MIENYAMQILIKIMTILVSGRVDFSTKKSIRDKEEGYVAIKITVYQKDITKLQNESLS